MSILRKFYEVYDFLDSPSGSTIFSIEPVKKCFTDAGFECTDVDGERAFTFEFGGMNIKVFFDDTLTGYAKNALKIKIGDDNEVSTRIDNNKWVPLHGLLLSKGSTGICISTLQPYNYTDYYDYYYRSYYIMFDTITNTIFTRFYNYNGSSDSLDNCKVRGFRLIDEVITTSTANISTSYNYNTEFDYTGKCKLDRWKYFGENIASGPQTYLPSITAGDTGTNGIIKIDNQYYIVLCAVVLRYEQKNVWVIFPLGEDINTL